MFTLKEAQLPGRTVRCSIPRTRTVRVVARAGRRNVDEEETEKQGGGLFGGLIGRGTQKLKAGQQDAESGPKGRQAKPSRGTKVLKNTPSRQGRGPGGFLQFLGTQAGGRKDSNTVFVAGATGRLGLRIVRELLLAGFKVRAGARNTERAQEYADLATGLGLLPADAAKRLQVVEVDLEDEDTIVSAIGNAGKVVQAIGAAENNVLDFGAPKRIDGNAAIALVEAAKQVGVEQYVMVTSLGTGKFGWPAAALNLFGGILVQKRRAEKYLEQSGLQYVIVRPGGMEKPTDDYKRTNNVRLQTRDKLFGGQVSRLQVAELISAAVANPELASNKILEVVAETEAPLLDYEMLLQQHPSEGEEQEVEDEDEVEEIPTPAPVASSRRKPAPQKAQPVQAEVVPEKPKGRWGFPSKQQEGIAEGIAKKEINLKLGKEDPTPSKQEQRLAEDIAKKEIAIASGQEEPVNKGFFGRFMGGQQAKKEALKPASRPEAPKAVAQEQQPAAAAQPALKPKKRETSQEELQRLESGRQKTSEVRASREADFLARLEQERTQEAQKKAQAAEKKAAEARKKLQEERQAKAAKLAAASKAAEEEAAASVKKVKAAAPAPPAAPKPKADSGDAKQALAKAKDNAKEARKWIDSWRAEQQGGKAGSPASNGAAPKAASKAAPKAAAGSQGKSDVPPNVAEAKEWIREWRAKSLETKLPQNTPANK